MSIWNANEYMKYHIYELRRNKLIIDWSSQLYTHLNWAVVKLKHEINSDLNRIRTHDLCDTGAVLFQLSYQVIWELITLWVRNIPVGGEGCKWIYDWSYIWIVENKLIVDWSSQLYTQLKHVVKLKLWICFRL